MEESKAMATDRLRREGRWNEASKLKDETIAQLRREGLSRQDAQSAGWRAMLQKFPPQEVSVDPLDPAADGLPDSSPATFLTDCYWVLNSLSKTTTGAEQAPTAGAWSLLRWARRNEHRFFEQILPKALTIGEKIDLGESDVEENLAHVATLEEMLRG